MATTTFRRIRCVVNTWPKAQPRPVCPWKGTASYYTVEVGDQVNEDAAWFYPDTKEAAKHFEGYVAFWKGVTVES